ncbi:MAG: biotin/lipoyl-containing protein [Acidobacteriota bacterium]
MKLQAEIGDAKRDVEIRREGEKVFADVDGRKYELELSEPEPNVFLFKHEGSIHEAVVTPVSKLGDPTHVRIGTNEFDIRVIDPKRLRSAGSGVEHADGLAEIKTAMPGKVVRVLLQPGSPVEAGASVLVVEAMKMQNELKSPKDGTIREIRVAEGDAVSAGDVLAVVE